MKKYNVYYRKEYDVYVDDKIKHFNETGNVVVEAESEEEARDVFF